MPETEVRPSAVTPEHPPVLCLDHVGQDHSQALLKIQQRRAAVLQLWINTMGILYIIPQRGHSRGRVKKGEGKRSGQVVRSDEGGQVVINFQYIS